jgi:hypothetical protein
MACDFLGGNKGHRMTKMNTHGQRSKTIAERFEEKVDRSSGVCWLWTSAIGTRGYGIFWVGGGRGSAFAHRFAFEMANPGVPMLPGALVMHSCDNPRCVNPAHLSLGSNSDNLMDASAKGRIARGERNGGGKKLTELQVRDILSSRAYLGCNKAAEKHGVSTQTIKAIRRGRIWKHVQQDATG